MSYNLTDIEEALPSNYQQLMKEYHVSADHREKHFTEKLKYVKDTNKKMYGVFDDEFTSASGFGVNSVSGITRSGCNPNVFHNGIREDLLYEYDKPVGCVWITPEQKEETNRLRIYRTDGGQIHARPEPSEQQTSKVLRKDETIHKLI